jgi:hypothetical protein
MHVLVRRAGLAAASLGRRVCIAAMAILPIVIAACGNNNGGSGY